MTFRLYKAVGVGETNTGTATQIKTNEQLYIGQIVFAGSSFWEILEEIQ